ncbi:MAG: hypothetical protein V1824_03285, partial [archaeon]
MNIYNYLYRIKKDFSYKLGFIKTIWYYLITFSYLKKYDLANNSKIKKILIVNDYALGDVLISTQFIKSVINNFKTTEVYLYINKNYFCFFEDLDIGLISNTNNLSKIDLIIDLNPNKENFEKFDALNAKYLFVRNPLTNRDKLSYKVTKIITPIYKKHITEYHNQILLD